MAIQNQTEQALFALLRSAIWGEERYPFQPEAEVDWNAVYEELRAQTVEVLPVDMLGRASPEMGAQCVRNAAGSVSRWYAMMEEQQALYDLFQENGIPFVILKGSAANIYYPQPEYRAMGDIDLIVRPADYDRALQCMRDNGYYVESLKNVRHAELEKNGVSFELHRYFAILNRAEGQELLDGMIWDAIGRAQVGQIEAYSFPMLPRLENGLVLLEHISQHLENGLGLRQIMDWMLYADRELDDGWYRDAVQPVLRQLRMEKLAVTVTRMCQIYLGLREDITWCREAEEALCHELMALILEQGNFGQKNQGDAKTISVLYLLGNVKCGFRTLQTAGGINWNALQRHPWLEPFAWLYQIGRYIRKGFALDHPLKRLFRNIRESRRQGRLLDRLGVTRWGKGVATPFGRQ